MAAFSDSMRKVATNLIKKLGNSCVLTSVTDKVYNPDLGKSIGTETPYNLFSAPVKKISYEMGLSGQNTNLSAFDTNKVNVAWFGQKVDSTWLYNGQNITQVEEVKAQDDIIMYTLTIGEK